MFDAIATVWRIAPALMQAMPEIKKSIAELQDVLREGEQAIRQLRKTVEVLGKAINSEEFKVEGEVLAKQMLVPESVTQEERGIVLAKEDEGRFFDRASGSADR